MVDRSYGKSTARQVLFDKGAHQALAISVEIGGRLIKKPQGYSHQQ